MHLNNWAERYDPVKHAANMLPGGKSRPFPNNDHMSRLDVRDPFAWHRDSGSELLPGKFWKTAESSNFPPMSRFA